MKTELKEKSLWRNLSNKTRAVSGSSFARTERGNDLHFWETFQLLGGSLDQSSFSAGILLSWVAVVICLQRIAITLSLYTHRAIPLQPVQTLHFHFSGFLYLDSHFLTRPELDVTIFFVHRMAFLLLALLVKCLSPITPPPLSSFINNSAGAQVKVMTAKLCVISPSHKIKVPLLQK